MEAFYYASNSHAALRERRRVLRPGGTFRCAVNFYFGNWEISHGLIDGDFAYTLLFLAVAAFGAGRIL